MKQKLDGWGFLSEVNKTSFSQALASFSGRLEGFPNDTPRMNCFGDSYVQWPSFIFNYMLEHARPIPPLSECEAVLVWFNKNDIDIFLSVARRPPEKAHQYSHKSPQSLAHMLWNKRGRNIKWPEHIDALKGGEALVGIPADKLWQSFKDWHEVANQSAPVLGREPHSQMTKIMQADGVALTPQWISQSLIGACVSPEAFLSRVVFINKHYPETLRQPVVWQEPKKINRVIAANMHPKRYADLWTKLSLLPNEIYQHVEPILANVMEDEWALIHRENHLRFITDKLFSSPRLKI